MIRKSVLITGTTGLLGQQLLQKLINEDFKVFATKRKNSTSLFHSSKVNWVCIDSFSENLFLNISECIDIVIHAAALVSYQKSDRECIFSVNTDWTKKLASDALNAGVSQFIFISSIAALGKKTHDKIINESTPFSAKHFITNYGKSKRSAEKALWEMSKQGLPIVIFNPSVIIGPAKKYQSSTQLFGYVRDKKPFYTAGIINYVDARDVSELVFMSIQNQIANEQFILSGGSTTYLNFFRLIAFRVNQNAPFIKVPKFMLHLGAFMENIYSTLNRKPPTLTTETARMAGNILIYDSKKAQKEFNYSFRDLSDSVKWTVEKMQKNGDL